MNTPAIRIHKMGKQFRILRKDQFHVMRDLLEDAVRAKVRFLTKSVRNRPESAPTHRTDSYIWALRNIDLEVERGEIFGLIGKNGSGKSVLLKILSRITKPTEGSAQIRGRIGSMLEVGTGFHPELSGRENIYLNGTILGMKKAEISRKFDEIVAFSEVENFLDMPVKRYSSGMRVRLAFSIAAHLETEILLLDEVLAVADLSFHEKCLQKLNEVAQEGRAVLFVSHDMATIERLCRRTMLLRDGRIHTIGPTKDVIAQFQDCQSRAS